MIGGKPRKANKRDDNRLSKRGRGRHKTAVVGVVQRKGNVHAEPVKKPTGRNLETVLRKVADIASTRLFTVEFPSYKPRGKFLTHQRVNHRKQSVSGGVHTNTIEGFWSLLKRSIMGQFDHVSPKHLAMYVNECSDKYNHRNADASTVIQPNHANHG